MLSNERNTFVSSNGQYNGKECMLTGPTARSDQWKFRSSGFVLSCQANFRLKSQMLALQ